jgi:hypothetical protein
LFLLWKRWFPPLTCVSLTCLPEWQ